jgi:RNA polymerase sigma factor (sigma-70 family)
MFMSSSSGLEEKKNERGRSVSVEFFSEEKLARFTEEMRELSLLTELPVDSHLFKHSIRDRDFESALFQIWERGQTAQTDLLCNSSLPTNERLILERKVNDGDEARSFLLRSNLRLVKWEARKHLWTGISLDDLFQEGYLGLEFALNRFNWRTGFKFSTRATLYIRQAITRGIANTGRTIRLPVHAGDTLARLQKARSRLELKFGRQPTLRELAAEVEMTEDKVIEALRFAAEPFSLSEPLREDGDAELGAVVEDCSAESSFEVVRTSQLPEEIQRFLAPLDEREREILKLRFGLDRGEPRTMEEVGELFNVSPERIRQIEARAMSKLRHPNKPDADQSEK